MELKRNKEKLAIVGTADTWKFAPFGSTEWECWGVNNLYVLLKENQKFDRWFEIHEIEFDGKSYMRRGMPVFRGKKVEDYMRELADLKLPIIMQKHWESIPQSIAFPLKDCLTAFPTRYFTNTISWELALGLMMGFQEIGIWGVDMAVGSEYHYQRPSVEYFIGIAEGRGIKIFIPNEADLLKTTFLYGFDEKRQSLYEKKLQLSIESMAKRQAEAKQIADMKTAEVHQYTGAISATKEISKIWSNLDTDMKLMGLKST